MATTIKPEFQLTERQIIKALLAAYPTDPELGAFIVRLIAAADKSLYGDHCSDVVVLEAATRLRLGGFSRRQKEIYRESAETDDECEDLECSLCKSKLLAYDDVVPRE